MPIFDLSHDSQLLLWAGEDARGDAARAGLLYANPKLSEIAACWGACHPAAIDYLRAAPVLIFWWPGKGVYSLRAGLRKMVGPRIAKGVPLSELMVDAKLPKVLRRLDGQALSKHLCHVVRDWLTWIDPVILGRIIPADTDLQRRWLLALERLHSRWPVRVAARMGAVASVAELLSRNQVYAGDLTSEIIDFIRYDGDLINPKWSWKRLTEESNLWHRRVVEKMVAKKYGLAADAVIDTCGLPLMAEVSGLEFHHLRTPKDLIEEGAAMRHCVGTYVDSVQRGECHIVAVRSPGGARVATMEVDHRGVIRQIKGRCNASVSKEVHGGCLYYHSAHVVPVVMAARRLRAGDRLTRYFPRREELVQEERLRGLPYYERQRALLGVADYYAPSEVRNTLGMDPGVGEFTAVAVAGATGREMTINITCDTSAMEVAFHEIRDRMTRRIDEALRLNRDEVHGRAATVVIRDEIDAWPQ